MEANNTKAKVHQYEDMNAHFGNAENGNTNATVTAEKSNPHSGTAESGNINPADSAVKSKALKNGAGADASSGKKSDEKVNAEEKRSGLQHCEGVDMSTGETLQHDVLASDGRHEMEEAMVLPALRRQQQVRLSVPGAFPVYPYEPHRNGDENERPIPNDERLAPQDNQAVAFTVAATLSPDQETVACGVRVRRPSYSSQSSSNVLTLTGPCDMDIETGEMQVAKLCTEEEEQPPFFKKWMIVSMVLTLLAVVVILALALAGVFGPCSVDDIDTQEALDPQEALDLPSVTTSVASLLEEVRDRGYLICHYLERPGFMFKNETTGEVAGFHSAWCAAVAAAIFGPDDLQSKIKYIDFLTPNSDHADVTSVGITPAMSRAIYLSYDPWNFGTMSFSAPVLYDGMRFAGDPFFVQCAEEFNFVDECEDLMVCVEGPSTYSTFVEEFLPARRYKIVMPGEDLEGVIKGECNALLTKQLMQTGGVLRSQGYEGNFTLGQRMFSHESWAVVTRGGDSRWTDFVNAVVQSVLVAEQHKITQATARQFPQTNVFGERFKDMFRNAIAAVGNLGEVYTKHFGHIPDREPANKINEGGSGLMYSSPFGELDDSRDVVDFPLGTHMSEILTRGKLLCGVHFGRPGFATQVDNGTSRGLDIDLCKAVAAGLFGDSDLLELVPLNTPGDGFQKLVSREVDVITGAEWNLENDVKEPTTGVGFSFTVPYYYGLGYENMCMVTLEGDSDWTAFVEWLVTSAIYAEENGINRTMFHKMPEVFSYGPSLNRMLRDAILAVGNYGEMYQRNLEPIVPRSGRNLLNSNSQGPQHFPMPGLV